MLIQVIYHMRTWAYRPALTEFSLIVENYLEIISVAALPICCNSFSAFNIFAPEPFRSFNVTIIILF